MKRFYSALFVFSIMFLLIPASGLSQTDPFPGITIKGQLTDLDGTPVSGPITITVRIYSVSEGGTPLYTEEFDTDLDNGLLNLNLGIGEGTSGDELLAALSPDQDGTYERFMTMEISSDGEMMPRRRITGSTYAAASVNSQFLGGLSSEAFARLESHNVFSQAQSMPSAEFTEPVGPPFSVGNPDPNSNLVPNLNADYFDGIESSSFARLDLTNIFQQQQIFFPNDPDIIPVEVKAAVGQTADLQEWQDDGGNVLASVSSAGGISAASYFGGSLLVQHPQPDFIPAIVRGALNQTANLQEWQNDAGNTLASVSYSGDFSISNLFADNALFFPTDPDIIPVEVRASAGQTANLQEWQDNLGNSLVAVAPTGAMTALSFSGSGAGLTNLNASELSSGIVEPAHGGTGLDASISSTGSIFYASSIGSWSTLPPGTTGQVLKLAGGIPTWGTDETGGGGGGVTQIDQGTGISLLPDPITSTGSISIDQTTVPLLASPNFFTRTQTIAPGSGLQEGLIIRANVNQVADLWRCEDNNSNVFAACDANGNITANSVMCSGQKCGVVPTSQGMTKLYAQESSEYWFEEFGEGDLIDGRLHIQLDDLFLETVTINDEHPMKVFIQPNDDFDTFVKRGKTGFDVIKRNGEKGEGHFTYRVVAKRRGYETTRLEPLEQYSENSPTE